MAWWAESRSRCNVASTRAASPASNASMGQAREHVAPEDARVVNRTGTLVNALLSRYRDLADRFPDSARPGIVHRLDKDTSGILIVAKHGAAHTHLAAQFSGRRVKKIYHAWVGGHPLPASGRIATRLRRDPRDALRFRCLPSRGSGR